MFLNSVLFLCFDHQTGKFVVTVLPPIPTKCYTSDDVAELAELVRKQMLGVFNETSMQRLETNGVY